MLSLRKRLALAHLAAVIAVLAVGAFVAHWTFSRTVHNELDAALLALAETELGMLAQNSDDPIVVHETTAGPAPPSFVRLDRLVQIVDLDGRVLARSANLGESQLPIPPVLRSRLRASETVFQTLDGFGEEPTRMVTVPMPSGPKRLAVQVAGSLDDVNRTVSSASVLFIAMGCALLLAVSMVDMFLTRRAFAAIDDVVQQAHRIGDTQLGDRLPHPGTHDEIGRLVQTLNDMLDRLEHSVETQRRFTADASHELRSPLSRLRTELELTLRRPRDVATYVRTLTSLLEEVERLSLLVEELLMLARLDAGQERGTAEAVSLNPLVQEAIRRAEPAARERAIRLVLAPSTVITAAVASSAFALVLANLLDNAVKFSRAGGVVVVSLKAIGAHAVLTVSDDGGGIEPTDLPHIFERFYRGSSARVDETPGIGLGLALSQALLHAHGARIEASNGDAGGARFVVTLPILTAI